MSICYNENDAKRGGELKKIVIFSILLSMIFGALPHVSAGGGVDAVPLWPYEIIVPLEYTSITSVWKGYFTTNDMDSVLHKLDGTKIVIPTAGVEYANIEYGYLVTGHTRGEPDERRMYVYTLCDEPELIVSGHTLSVYENDLCMVMVTVEYVSQSHGWIGDRVMVDLTTGNIVEQLGVGNMLYSNSNGFVDTINWSIKEHIVYDDDGQAIVDLNLFAQNHKVSSGVRYHPLQHVITADYDDRQYIFPNADGYCINKPVTRTIFSR